MWLFSLGPSTLLCDSYVNQPGNTHLVIVYLTLASYTIPENFPFMALQMKLDAYK